MKSQMSNRWRYASLGLIIFLTLNTGCAGLQILTSNALTAIVGSASTAIVEIFNPTPMMDVSGAMP